MVPDDSDEPIVVEDEQPVEVDSSEAADEPEILEHDHHDDVQMAYEQGFLDAIRDQHLGFLAPDDEDDPVVVDHPYHVQLEPTDVGIVQEPIREILAVTPPVASSTPRNIPKYVHRKNDV